MPQAVDTTGLPVLGDKWRDENPYRTNKLALKIGTSAYTQNCARCHGLDAVSGGIAPDLRLLDRDCNGIKNETKKQACYKEMDNYYPTATEALQQLKAGQLDAVLATRSEIESVLRGDPAFPVQDVPFERLPRAGWAIGMAVKKDNVDLARRLQAALNEMAADGELKAVFAKYGVQIVKP